MLEQLVESKNNKKEAAQRAKFLGTTLVLVLTLAFSGVLWSLFAKDIAMSAEKMELSTLIAPVSPPETKPPTAEPKQPQPPKTAMKSALNETTRQANILRIEENPKVPTETSVVPNAQKSRPNAPFTLKEGIETDFQTSSSNPLGDRTGGGNIGGEIGKPDDSSKNYAEAIKNPPPPPPPLKTKIEAQPKTVIRSIGVINGKATNLPKPPYPQAAKIVRASGDVNVQVTIDETGRVISASAVSGHPLLRDAAERAAKSAKFNPTLLNNQAVKVTGVIVYKFSNN